MALDLDKIIFAVDTTALDTAITKIEKLGTAVTTLNKPIEKLEKVTGDASKSVDKVAKSSGEATDKVEALQKKLENTYKDLSQGFTKGESSILNYARTLGIAEDALKPIQEQLKLIGKLTSDPFDSAIGSIRSVTKEFEMMNHRADLASKGIILTAKQLKEYSRVADEVSAKITSQGFDPTSGKGLADYTKGVERLQAKYLGLAGTVSEARQAEQQNQQAIKDSAKATDFLTREMQRAENALNGMNESMNISTSNRLLRFKEAMKASGVETAQATALLQKYEATLKATDAASTTKKGRTRKDELDYLARATSVQLGDIGVSLAGGQNPLIVMIQQGDQLRSVLNQVGGDAKEMQQAMSLAFKQIVVGFIDVGKALGTFVGGAFKDTANSLLSFTGRITGITPLIESARYQLTLMSMASDGFTAAMGRAGASLLAFTGAASIAIAATGIGALVIALVALAVGLKQVIAQESELSKAVNLTGGSLGLNADAARGLAQAYAGAGNNTGAFVTAITEVAKAGNITQESLKLVTTTAVYLEKVAGVAISETVKQFSEIGKEPVESAIKLAKSTGLITPEVISLAAAAERQGDKMEAARIVTEAYSAGLTKAALNIKNDMGYLELFFSGIGSAASKMWDRILNVGRAGSLSEQLNNAKAELAKAQSGGSFFAFTDQAKQTEVRLAEIRIAGIEKEIAAQEKANQVKAENARIAGVQQEAEKKLDDLKKSAEKLDEKKLTRQQFINKEMDTYNKLIAKGAIISKDALVEAERTAGLTWDSQQKKAKTGKSEAEKELERFIKLKGDLADKDRDLNANYSESFALIVKLAKTEEERVDLITKLLKQQPLYAAGIKAEAESHKENQKALDDWVAVFTKAEELRNKAIAEQEKLNAEVAGETEQVRIRIRTIGMESSEREKYIALLKAQTKYTKELADIKGDKAGDKEIRSAEALARYEQTLLNINTNVAIDAAEKLLAEYRRIRDGITDSIVTALFEGGKAGSKKLRDLIITELKKPVTLVVNALVNTIMGSVTGAALGGLGGVGGLLGTGSALYGAGSTVAGWFGLGAGGGIAASAGGYGLATGATGLGLGAGGGLGLGAGGSGLGLTAGGAGGGAAAGAGGFGAAMPWIGGALILLSLLSGLDDSGTMHTGGAASYSKAKGSRTATAAELAQGNALGLGLADIDYSESATSFAAQFVKSISEMLDDTAKVFGKTAGYEISTAFADDASKDGSWGSLVIKKNGQTLVDWQKDQTSRWAPREFADGEAGKKEYLIAVAKDVRTTLKAEVPDWADTMLDALGDAPSIEGLAQTVLLINQTQLAFETMGRASANFANLTDEATAALIAAAGGAAELVTALESYYTNFYTAEERRTLETARLQGEFSRLNKTMPRTREEFRAMMEAAIAAGDTTLVAELLKLAPAFASVTDATVDATTAANQHAAALQATYDASRAATDEALRVAKEVINREKAKAVAALASAEAIRSSLQSVFDTLINNIRELYAEVTSTNAMQVSEARANIAEAISTGVVKDNKVLGQSITTIRNSFSASNYATKFEADRARLQFAAELAGLAGIIEPQLTAAEQQVELLKDQIKQFDDLLEHLDEQLAILRGTSTTTLSIDDTLTNLLAIAEEERAARNAVNANNPAGGTGGNFVIGGSAPGQANRPAPAASTLSSRGNTYYGSMGIAITNQPDVNRYDSVNAYINTLSWAPGDKAASSAALAEAARQYGVGTRDLAIASGYSEADIEALLAGQNVPRFESGGYHSGGLRLVGEQGAELEVTGPSRIFNANQTANMLNGLGSDNGSIQQELSMLRMESIATAQNTAKLARLVERLIVPTNSGDALQTKAVV